MLTIRLQTNGLHKRQGKQNCLRWLQSTLENPPEQVEDEELEKTAREESERREREKTAENTTGKTAGDITEDVAVPSQADLLNLLKGIGGKVRSSRKKGNVNLDAIVHYVQTKQTWTTLNSQEICRIPA